MYSMCTYTYVANSCKKVYVLPVSSQENFGQYSLLGVWLLPVSQGYALNFIREGLRTFAEA